MDLFLHDLAFQWGGAESVLRCLANLNPVAPVAVIGEGARTNLFGAKDPIGEYVKVNEQWFRVIGMVGPQVSSQTDVAGIPSEDRNNLIYVPVAAAILRLEDSYSRFKDEIDGIYLQMQPGEDIPSAVSLLRGLLNVSHRQAGDFTIVAPVFFMENFLTRRYLEHFRDNRLPMPISAAILLRSARTSAFALMYCG